jgi:nucleoside-diphosphate-sugar epimerase
MIEFLGRRALITGATGFIGFHLARRLARSGCEVHLLVRPGSEERVTAIGEKVTTHYYDGSIDSVMKAVESSTPGVVFHLASLFLAQHKPDDVEALIRSNLLLGTQLLEAMASSGRTLLVNTGTAWQHFNNRNYSPVALYAATKQAFEAIIRYYVEAREFRVVTLKLFDTYGPEDPRSKLLTSLRKAALNNTPLSMSPGWQRIDLVHIDDVVNAFIMTGNRLMSGIGESEESYAISSGNPLSLRELVAIVQQCVGPGLVIEWGALPYRPREVMIPWSSGKCLPGWKAAIGLSDGIKQLEKDMR